MIGYVGAEGIEIQGRIRMNDSPHSLGLDCVLSLEARS